MASIVQWFTVKNCPTNKLLTMERIAMFMTTYILVNLKVLLGNYEFALSTFTVIAPNESTMQANVSKTHILLHKCIRKCHL